MRRLLSRLACTVAALALVAAPIARAADDWQPPKDGLFTEKQLTNYVAAYKDWMDLMKAYGKALDGSKSGAGALVIAAGLDDKFNENVKKHDLKRAEFDWLSGQVTSCLGVALIDEQLDAGKKDLEEQKKKVADSIEAGKKRVADLEQASKANTRVLTKEQREQAIANAKDAQNSALDEAKQHAQEAKDAADEAAKYEADAKEAEKLAKNPPPDVDADGRTDYVNGKKEEAQNARNSAKESRDKEKEARKAEAESKAKAAQAVNQAAHPEVPVTDEEKAQVKQENEAALTAAKDDLKSTMQGAELLKGSDDQFAKTTAEMHKEIKEPNLGLVRKHLAEIKQAWGVDKK